MSRGGSGAGGHHREEHTGDGASPRTRSQPTLIGRTCQNQHDRQGLRGRRGETRTPCWHWGLGQGYVSKQSGARPAAEADTQKALPGTRDLVHTELFRGAEGSRQTKGTKKHAAQWFAGWKRWARRPTPEAWRDPVILPKGDPCRAATFCPCMLWGDRGGACAGRRGGPVEWEAPCLCCVPATASPAPQTA